MHKSLCDALAEFFKKSKEPILFAGAGVSARAGIPVWGGYLTGLAEAIRPYDPGTRDLMLKRIKEKRYLNAAQLYLLSPDMREVEKYSAIRSPLEHFKSDAIQPITRLPFKAYVTTNYDRALYDAYASEYGESAIPVHLDDPTLKAAQFYKEFYIARIHGRSEVPDRIVLSEEHYRELQANLIYQDFVSHLFTRKQLLFVGFSFLDPAIKHVLSVVQKHSSRIHDGLHIALLPDDADGEFITELERNNISKILYSSSNDHKELWECLENFELQPKAVAIAQANHAEPFLGAQRYLASCYARAKMGEQLTPLRLAILEGVVSEAIQASKDAGISENEIANLISQELSIEKATASSLIKEPVNLLLREGLCKLKQRDEVQVFVWSGSNDHSYQSALNTLTNGIINRFVVRENGKDTKANRQCIDAFLRKLILSRGWDLGAAFAARRPPDTIDVRGIMFSVQEFTKYNNLENRDALSRAAEELLRHPEPTESEVLIELGRVSFGLELVLQSPRDTLFHSITLPERLYLDANVLMPAIVKGHPFHDVYRKTIDRLRAAAVKAAQKLEIIVYSGFLNEVISHRRLAEEELQHIDNNHRDALKREALFVGTPNLNVFVGAYANQLAVEPSLTFPNFLSRYAPYNDEKQLTAWLIKQDMLIHKQPEMLNKNSAYADILHLLEIEYADEVSVRQKTALLIGHDAVQLSAVERDLKFGTRTLLVSADRRLRDKISKGVFAHIGNAMISPLGLTQLIDLLVGSPKETRGLSSMMWIAKGSDTMQHVRDYFINIALLKYQDAIDQKMHKLIDDLAEDFTAAAEKEKLSIPPNEKERGKTYRLLEQFEEKFFQKMREVHDRQIS